MAVRITPDQREALVRLAEEDQRSASSLIREAVAALIRERSEPVEA